MTHLKPALLLAVTLAFGLAPLITPPFTGYDPTIFPVRIERPSIQPAGYAFGIWSVIYLWLIAHAVFGLWSRRDDPLWDAPRWPLILAIGLGALWLAIAGSFPIVATLAIWVMMAASVTAFLLADTRVDRWMLSGPTAILSGWLTAAAAVSLGVVLAGHGWLSDTGAAVAMLALVLAIAIAVQWRKPAMPVYGLTVIWALGGVISANARETISVAVLATIGALVMATVLVLRRRS